jgi:hypothetical protein
MAIHGPRGQEMVRLDGGSGCFLYIEWVNTAPAQIVGDGFESAIKDLDTSRSRGRSMDVACSFLAHFRRQAASKISSRKASISIVDKTTKTVLRSRYN